MQFIFLALAAFAGKLCRQRALVRNAAGCLLTCPKLEQELSAFSRCFPTWLVSSTSLLNTWLLIALEIITFKLLVGDFWFLCGLFVDSKKLSCNWSALVPGAGHCLALLFGLRYL